ESLIHRGLMLQRHHDQVQLVTRPELAGYVRRALRPEVTGRLSAAAYETLAIVAYQQPVSRAKIEEVRGVNSDGVLANLELRDLARTGVASRRAADSLIASGVVRVNGRRPPESGTLVEPGVDSVTVDGRRVEPVQDHQYLVLHKPAGVVVTARDPQGRPTVLD